jgi:CheY-like chemotaxis protein
MALSEAESFRPEIVLLDIGLPGMDGYEVARRFRDGPNGSDAFLVALTGYGQEEARDRSLGAGFDRHLVKPITHADLEAVLRTVPARP